MSREQQHSPLYLMQLLWREAVRTGPIANINESLHRILFGEDICVPEHLKQRVRAKRRQRRPETEDNKNGH